MRKFIVLALIVVGVWYWYKDKSAKEVAFDKSGAPVVVAFTARDCPPCQEAVDFLRRRGVPFDERELNPAGDEDRNVKIWKSASDGRLPLVLAGDKKVLGMSKWELIDLLGANYGDQFLTNGEKRYFQQHFDSGGSPKVVVYGADWCPYTAELRNQLRSNGVSFLEIDVEKSGEHREMSRIMEIPGYPTTWVGYRRVNGTSFDAVKAAINKAR